MEGITLKTNLRGNIDYLSAFNIKQYFKVILSAASSAYKK